MSYLEFCQASELAVVSLPEEDKVFLPLSQALKPQVCLKQAIVIVLHSVLSVITGDWCWSDPYPKLTHTDVAG